MYRLRFPLIPVGAPLGVAIALVGDGGGNLGPGPLSILVHVERSRSHVREILPRSSIMCQGLPQRPVGLREGSAAGGSQKPIRRPGGSVYGRFGKGADVDRPLLTWARPERQVLEPPPPALVSYMPFFPSPPDHLNPLLEERGPVLAVKIQGL